MCVHVLDKPFLEMVTQIANGVPSLCTEERLDKLSEQSGISYIN